ncbi:MAG: CHRD domain-containing protein [Betaproteobacteria bacterium]
MTTMRQLRIFALTIAGAAVILAGCQSMRPMMGAQTVALSGANEVPPVTTTATGSATVLIDADRSVRVTVSVAGMTPTASHIHEGAAGANGPVIVPFTKTGDMTFASADGAKLTEAQYAAYKAGNLYINVHSAKNPGGEVRGQIKG